VFIILVCLIFVWNIHRHKNIYMSMGTSCWPSFLHLFSYQFPQALERAYEYPGTVYLSWSVVCSSTSIISTVLTVIDISSLFHVYLITSGPPYNGVEIDSFQLFSRRSHSQLDARSAAWLSLWIVLRLALPVVRIAAISRHTDWEQNPLAFTSMRNSQ